MGHCAWDWDWEGHMDARRRLRHRANNNGSLFQLGWFMWVRGCWLRCGCVYFHFAMVGVLYFCFGGSKVILFRSLLDVVA